jgi:hypothetical protein
MNLLAIMAVGWWLDDWRGTQSGIQTLEVRRSVGVKAGYTHWYSDNLADWHSESLRK